MWYVFIFDLIYPVVLRACSIRRDATFAPRLVKDSLDLFFSWSRSLLGTQACIVSNESWFLQEGLGGHICLSAISYLVSPEILSFFGCLPVCCFAQSRHLVGPLFEALPKCGIRKWLLYFLSKSLHARWKVLVSYWQQVSATNHSKLLNIENNCERVDSLRWSKILCRLS